MIRVLLAFIANLLLITVGSAIFALFWTVILTAIYYLFKGADDVHETAQAIFIFTFFWIIFIKGMNRLQPLLYLRSEVFLKENMITLKEAYNKAYDSGYTKKLEETACKYSYYAYKFARDIPGANIEYCQEHACKDPLWSYYFACDIPGANLNHCLEACKETKYYAKIQVHIMEEAIR